MKIDVKPDNEISVNHCNYLMKGAHNDLYIEATNKIRKLQKYFFPLVFGLFGDFKSMQFFAAPFCLLFPGFISKHFHHDKFLWIT